MDKIEQIIKEWNTGLTIEDLAKRHYYLREHIYAITEFREALSVEDIADKIDFVKSGMETTEINKIMSMDLIFLVMEWNGEKYDDSAEWPIKAYPDRPSALLHVAMDAERYRVIACLYEEKKS